MKDDHQDISKLLRLKRFEQPAPEYYEDFLTEFRERQRSQLLREPAWRIAWDRVCAWMGEQMPSRVGYGLASTAVLVAAAITSFNILESRPAADVASSAPVRQPSQIASLNLNTAADQPDLPEFDRTAHPASISAAPRYVMDARPVSYEPPSSF